MQRYIGTQDARTRTGDQNGSITGRLLITGGTGFIGGAILAELARTPIWDNVLILVRGASVAGARSRVCRSIGRFEPTGSEPAPLRDDQIVVGGLEDFAELQRDTRISAVTHVIHAAAVTSFSKSARIRAVNVEASLGFVRMLDACAELKRFVYVGTAWCVGLKAGACIPEGQLEDNGRHLVPYTESKLEFERAVRHQFPHLPFVSARPSIVVGHTTLGATPSASIYWVFHSAALLGSFTCSLDDRIDVVPVDWVARALITLTTKPSLAHDAYHISAGDDASSSFASIDTAIARGRNREPYGRTRYRKLDEKQLVLTVFAQRKLFGGASPWVLAPALGLYGQFAKSDTCFDNARLLAEGVEAPPRFSSYADRCAASAEHLSIAEQMEDDFK
ncbi:MAG: SDR family oxidoreductase [Proteobacteria bacterium]|nr:SDR family oxidoreductase [Pseudomonadota bacterium]